MLRNSENLTTMAIQFYFFHYLLVSPIAWPSNNLASFSSLEKFLLSEPFSFHVLTYNIFLFTATSLYLLHHYDRSVFAFPCCNHWRLIQLMTTPFSISSLHFPQIPFPNLSSKLPLFLFILFIFYLINVGKKNIQLKVQRRNSFP